MMKNKRGWIKIVEAFIAILLLTGIVLFVINRQSDDVQQVYSLIQDAQTSILRNAQLNNTVRTEILSTNGQVDWGSFSTQAPNTMAEIQSNTPNYLSCQAKICDVGGPCVFFGTSPAGESIYVDSVMISSTSNTFKPRMLKLFCWEK